VSNLRSQQRALLGLIKGRVDGCPTDPYVAAVARSPELAMLREIAIWWRAYQIQRSCPLSSGLLHRLQEFDHNVEAFFCSRPTSPFVEQLSADFLAYLADGSNHLVATVASFEAGLIDAKIGREREHVIEWDRNPDGVLRAIAEGAAIPDPEPGFTYTTRISAALPHLVECTLVRDLEPALL
jgi:hypothetical protein